MKITSVLGTAMAVSLCQLAAADIFAATDFTAMVDPFIGTGSGGYGLTM